MEMNFEKELPNRKGTRLKNYDYSTTGAYFVTICTHNRNNILSTIAVGEGFPLPHESTSLQLSLYGMVVEKWIRELPNKYQNISVDCYVIMPNHIHMLLIVSSNIENGGGRGDPSPTAITTAIGWMKYQITKEINQIRRTPGENVLQRSFHDHVIRNRDDYNKIYKYIYENPLRWRYDRLYSEE